MEGAQSECIVPSGHPAHQNPQAIEEVHRILEVNAGKSPASREGFRPGKLPPKHLATGDLLIRRGG
jgi:hypothetical protein